MRALVDTNVVVAVMVADDVNHGRALEAWRRVSEAYVSAVTVSELAYFFLKHGSGSHRSTRWRQTRRWR